MLGNKVIQGQGKVTGTRVLRGDDYRYMKMEFSFQESGTALGTPYTNYGTYTIFERIPGQLYGEGQGILETADGEGAIWTGAGIGHMTGEGLSVKFSAAVTFQAGDGKLKALKDNLVIFEFSQDNEGNITVAGWEWKA